ncbi:hypothetical protein [Periweissella fabalis]|uniref:Uncharacterized protein n=1 Tax=Periweissella fabalis TaxID=1070421 RepID=A0A7X6N0T0_9LACO|nr:hypothetical protein [Periweissella fabalis]MCM0599419.1 hypothetical protein [Periweissella fabalis]NKZ23698.1 hypothetical protein [Periweissella fabalis]
MLKLKKAQIIFGIVIALIVAFVIGIDINHYHQNKRANEMQMAIDKQINYHVSADRANVKVPNPKHINIILKGGTANQVADVLNANKQLKNFDFWKYLKIKVNHTDDSVRQQFGKDITLSLMDPNNPTKPIYSVRDGKVIYDKSSTVTNIN